MDPVAKANNLLKRIDGFLDELRLVLGELYAEREKNQMEIERAEIIISKLKERARKLNIGAAHAAAGAIEVNDVQT